MRLMKRILSAAAVLALSASLLVGCSSGTASSVPVSASSAAESTVSSVEETASCIYTQKGNKKIRKPQAANQTALIFDRRAAARLLSINSIRRLCWS